MEKKVTQYIEEFTQILREAVIEARKNYRGQPFYFCKPYIRFSYNNDGKPRDNYDVNSGGVGVRELKEMIKDDRYTFVSIESALYAWDSYRDRFEGLSAEPCNEYVTLTVKEIQNERKIES